MFETIEEKQAEAIFATIDEDMKHMIANSLQAACIISQNLIEDSTALGIPKTKKFNVACQLPYIANKLLTKMIDVYNKPNISYSEDGQCRGRPTIHIKDGNVIMHIKKANNPENLPTKANFREEEAKHNEQLKLNFPNSEIYEPAYMIITFNHKNFRLQYIQIGMADTNYERWLGRWGIMDHINNDAVDKIVKEYGPDMIKEAVDYEEIQKSYSLGVRA